MTPPTEQSVNETNEVIAVFDGWEIVSIGYWGEQNEFDLHNQTEWQTNNRDWLDKVGMYQVGTYAVKVKEDLWKEWEGGEYHSDWNLLHGAWDKAYDYYKLNLDKWPTVQDFVLKLYEPMKNAMITSNITTAHRILYDAIMFVKNNEG